MKETLRAASDSTACQKTHFFTLEENLCTYVEFTTTIGVDGINHTGGLTTLTAATFMQPKIRKQDRNAEKRKQQILHLKNKHRFSAFQACNIFQKTVQGLWSFSPFVMSSFLLTTLKIYSDSGSRK